MFSKRLIAAGILGVGLGAGTYATYQECPSLEQAVCEKYHNYTSKPPPNFLLRSETSRQITMDRESLKKTDNRGLNRTDQWYEAKFWHDYVFSHNIYTIADSLDICPPEYQTPHLFKKIPQEFIGYLKPLPQYHDQLIQEICDRIMKGIRLQRVRIEYVPDIYNEIKKRKPDYDDYRQTLRWAFSGHIMGIPLPADIFRDIFPEYKEVPDKPNILYSCDLTPLDQFDLSPCLGEHKIDYKSE
jgi:hypothetical protein